MSAAMLFLACRSAEVCAKDLRREVDPYWRRGCAALLPAGGS